jgi:hypothetical protein
MMMINREKGLDKLVVGLLVLIWCDSLLSKFFQFCKESFGKRREERNSRRRGQRLLCGFYMLLPLHFIHSSDTNMEGSWRGNQLNQTPTHIYCRVLFSVAHAGIIR